MNGSVVRTQHFRLLFHVEPVQIVQSTYTFKYLCRVLGYSVGCYTITSLPTVQTVQSTVQIYSAVSYAILLLSYAILRYLQ